MLRRRPKLRDMTPEQKKLYYRVQKKRNLEEIAARSQRLGFPTSLAEVKADIIDFVFEEIAKDSLLGREMLEELSNRHENSENAALAFKARSRDHIKRNRR